MKEDIKEILKGYALEVQRGEYAVFEEYWDEVAEEIEKLRKSDLINYTRWLLNERKPLEKDEWFPKIVIEYMKSH